MPILFTFSPLSVDKWSLLPSKASPSSCAIPFPTWQQQLHRFPSFSYVVKFSISSGSFLCACKNSVILHISKIKFHPIICALHFCDLFYNPVPPKSCLNLLITHSVVCVEFFQYIRHFPGYQAYSNEQNRYIFALIEDIYWISQVVLVVKNPPPNTGNLRDTGLSLVSTRLPGAGNSNPLQYSCLENPRDREA